MDSQTKNPSSNLVNVEDVTTLLSICTEGNAINSEFRSIGNAIEIEHFLRTGDFKAQTEKISCLNPTFFTLSNTNWEVIQKYNNYFYLIIFFTTTQL